MVTDVFLDFALISGLLVVAHLLRTWVRFFQAVFLPTPILAGLIGLAAGPEGLDLLPFARDAAGAPAMGRYPGELIVVLFGTLFMGWRPNAPRFRAMLRDVGDTFFYNLSAWVGQFGLALLFAGAVLIPLFPEVGGPFALMLPGGFVGGHGTATAIGSVLAEQGYLDALAVGYTFATIGLLAAVFGGVAAINLATRAGWTRLVSSPHELPEDQRRGLIAPDDARDAVKETVSPLALDTLSWHFGLVLLAYGAAHAASWALRSAGGLFTALPMFALAVICGALLQGVLNRLGVGRNVDRATMARIGSSVSDFLVAFGIASIPLSTVAAYAAPILVMSVFGFAHAALITWWIARRTFRNYWFERGLFTFGYATGVVGMGIALLRVVDPQRKSGTLDDYGVAYLPIAMIEIAILTTLPLWVAAGAVWMPGLALTAFAAALLLISWKSIGFFPSDPGIRRTGEPMGRRATRGMHRLHSRRGVDGGSERVLVALPASGEGQEDVDSPKSGAPAAFPAPLPPWDSLPRSLAAMAAPTLPSPTVPPPTPAPAPPPAPDPMGARCTEAGRLLEYGFFAHFEPISYSASQDPGAAAFDEHLGYEADLLNALEAMDGAGLAFRRRGIDVWPGIWLLPSTPRVTTSWAAASRSLRSARSMPPGCRPSRSRPGTSNSAIRFSYARPMPSGSRNTAT